MIVDLPHPECPMMHTNSPCSMVKSAFSKTVSGSPPLGAGKRLVSLVISMNALLIESSYPPCSGYSWNCTALCSRAKAASRSMPTTPIIRIEKITLVRSRLFHSFQT